MERINRGIVLEDFGLDDKTVMDIKNLPLIIELGKKIYRENSGYGVWDSYGYKHHIHSRILKECLDILKPLADRILEESEKISINEILKSFNEIKKEPRISVNFKDINKKAVFVVHGRDENNIKAMFKF